MGREAACKARFGGREGTGKALLETREIVFRGDGLRFTIALGGVQKVSVRGGTLVIRGAEGEARLELGPDAAAAWAARIENPPSRLQKLGVKAGMKVSLVGRLEAAFVSELRGAVDDLSDGKARPGSDLLFFAAETPADLGRLPALKKSLQPAGALWVVRAKGPAAAVTEAAAMAAGKAAGLVDTKVVAFSATHTAERFVIPVSKR
jgi:hypothetical protein